MTTVSELKQEIISLLGATAYTEKQFTKAVCNGILLNRLPDGNDSLIKATSLTTYTNKQYWEYALVIAQQLVAARKAQLEQIAYEKQEELERAEVLETNDIDILGAQEKLSNEGMLEADLLGYRATQYPYIYFNDYHGVVACIGNELCSVLADLSQATLDGVVIELGAEVTFSEGKYIWDGKQFTRLQTFNGTIDMMLLAFNIKLTATVIELYCSELSQSCHYGDISYPFVEADALGTKAMWLGFEASELFFNTFPTRHEFPDYWIDILNYCIDVIQPILPLEEVRAQVLALGIPESMVVNPGGTGTLAVWKLALALATKPQVIEDKEVASEESYNGIIDMMLLAFNVKLTATVVEIYCYEISKIHQFSDALYPFVNVDKLGTDAMHLSWDANELFYKPIYRYEDCIPAWWFDALNYCIDVIQPILPLVSDADREALEAIYALPQAWYWDTEKHSLVEAG